MGDDGADGGGDGLQMRIAGDAAISVLDIDAVAVAAAPACFDHFAVPGGVNRISCIAVDINACMEAPASLAIGRADAGSSGRPDHRLIIHWDAIDHRRNAGRSRTGHGLNGIGRQILNLGIGIIVNSWLIIFGCYCFAPLRIRVDEIDPVHIGYKMDLPIDDLFVEI